ncbi:hypothetical protein [Baia soyae]|uniref:Uncharacterized protein n=1 Tax=Baia soyae TaxID=1544746 RepID=A0A4R2RF41_9BACL|nr:hypothetical protein [Baia soyae]TCP61048.1 hypothetical protein EDD57_1653 [Baia soyae]
MGTPDDGAEWAQVGKDLNRCLHDPDKSLICTVGKAIGGAAKDVYDWMTAGKPCRPSRSGMGDC